MTVKQTDEQEGPASLTVYFAERLSNAASVGVNAGGTAGGGAGPDKFAPEAGQAEKTAVLDLKDLDFKKIWEKVQMVTGAREVAATEAEAEEAKRLENMRVQSGADRERNANIRQAKKDQERMLQEARGEVERLKQM